MDGHVDSDVLVQYVAGDLAAVDQQDVFGHLAFCEACRVRVHALRSIAAEPDVAWAVLPQANGTARPESVVTPGLRWATLRIVVDAARKVAAVTVDMLADVSAGDWACRPLPAAFGVGDASALCRVSAGEPRVEMGMQSDGIGTVTVVADARRDAVAVILEPPVDETARQRLLARGPRAVLADERGSTRFVARFESVPGATYLLAEFERPDGTNWVLNLEFEH